MTPAETKKESTLAIVCNTLPPYRLHAHRRFATEMPGVRLVTINTHTDVTRDWQTEIDSEIGLVDLSDGDRGKQSWLREWRRGGAVIKTLEEQRADAVVVNGYNDAGRRRVIRWCRANGVPCFLWGDSNLASDKMTAGWKRRLKKFLISPIIWSCTGCIGCGRLGRAYFEHYGADPQRVFVSPYEPDYELIQAMPAERISKVASELGLADNRRRIVYCGRLTAVKRVDIAIQSFVNLAEDRPEWDLVILGDGELRGELESLVPDGLKSRVIWTGFLAEQGDVSAVYRASDVLVLPSTFEPWALVVNEAVAAGMAIVTTDVVGAAAELVRDGVNGRVVPPGELAPYQQALADTTAPENIDRMKAASAEVLADWRRVGDPVQGLAEALRFAGVPE